MTSPGYQETLRRGEARRETVARRWRRAKRYRFDTLAVHGLYTVGEALSRNQGAVIEPLYASTSQAFRDADHMQAALAYEVPAWAYARIHNPTQQYLEWTLALLETYGSDLGASALACASGMAAIRAATDPFCVDPRRGRTNFVSTAQVYGGTFQQFAVRRAQEGVTVRWVRDATDLEEWEARIDEQTRFLYGELPSNPQQGFFDIAAVAALAHRHGLPLIVDSTIATPALLRPLLHGADIVVHSLTKDMTTSGFGIGGALIARRDLDYDILPEEARDDFATWVKLWPGRDNGPAISPFNCLMVLNDLRTLRSRLDLLSRNTLVVAEFLVDHPAVARVDWLGLESHPLHALATRYLRLADDGAPRYGHLMSFRLGDADAARRVFDRLALIFRATDLGRIKSVATIPAISTHQQQGEAARAMADVPPSLVRLCVGGEAPEDLIADLAQALEAA